MTDLLSKKGTTGVTWREAPQREKVGLYEAKAKAEMPSETQCIQATDRLGGTKVKDV